MWCESTTNPVPSGASRHRAVSRNWPKIEWNRPMVTQHLPWKFHANRSSGFLVILLTKKQRKKETTSCGATAQQTPSPCYTSRGFSKLTKNVIRSSHGHSTLSLKISCKSVQQFSHNLANKERKKERQKETKKSIENKYTRPPIYRERGNNKNHEIPGG